MIYSPKIRRLQDIERHEGCFIRKKCLKANGRYGIYSGTLMFGVRKANAIVKAYRYGGGTILCTMPNEDIAAVDKYLANLEADVHSGYHAELQTRRTCISMYRIMLLVLAFFTYPAIHGIIEVRSLQTVAVALCTAAAWYLTLWMQRKLNRI